MTRLKIILHLSRKTTLRLKVLNIKYLIKTEIFSPKYSKNLSSFISQNKAELKLFSISSWNLYLLISLSSTFLHILYAQTMITKPQMHNGKRMYFYLQKRFKPFQKYERNKKKFLLCFTICSSLCLLFFSFNKTSPERRIMQFGLRALSQQNFCLSLYSLMLALMLMRYVYKYFLEINTLYV